MYSFVFPDNKCNAYSRERACKIVNFAQKGENVSMAEWN